MAALLLGAGCSTPAANTAQLSATPTALATTTEPVASRAPSPTVAAPATAEATRSTDPTPQATVAQSPLPVAPTAPPTLRPSTPPPTPTVVRTVTPTLQPTLPPATQPPATQPPATQQPTPQATPQPTPQPTARPVTFTLLPPGSALPTDQQCAAAIVRDPFEPRPENRTANQSNAWANGFRLTGSYLASIASGYESRVTGNFTGTTDEILRWGACKWGFDENDVRAQAVIESYWRQSLAADCGVPSQPQTNGCASVGILQVKGADVPATHPGTWPAAWTSTAFNVDYTLAVRRLCFDGKETWLRDYNATYGAGDVWGCIGRWFSGRWHDGPSESYIAQVRATLNARTWASAGF